MSEVAGRMSIQEGAKYLEKPQMGRLFKAQGTNSVAVFYTVVNHSQEDKLIAGILIVAPMGPNQVEAALLSDDAAHFGLSVDPMLNRLA